MNARNDSATKVGRDTTPTSQVARPTVAPTGQPNDAVLNTRDVCGGAPKSRPADAQLHGAALRHELEQRIRAGEFAAVQPDIERYVAQVALDPIGWTLLGLALRGQGKAAAAVVAYRRAQELSPAGVAPLTNLGNALKDLQRLDEAVATHSLATEADATSVTHWLNLGVALRERGDLHGALSAFENVQRLAPNDVNGHWDRAQILLMLGRFAEGWREFEWRWQLPETSAQAFAEPQWHGERRPEATVFLWPEQGFGDSILATRYLPWVKERVRQVIVGCRPELAPLLRGFPGVDRVVVVGEGIPHFDVHCPLMSLPGIFSPDSTQIPRPVASVVPAESQARLAPWLARGGRRFKVGIVWSGSVTFKGNYLRSTALEAFLPLGEVPGVQLFSLQKGPREVDLDAVGARGLVIDLAPALKSFADTAAALDGLDLVIMTDSSVAHLAASRGRPVWNLLAYVPYWLYLRDRIDSPWYPSMRLFRQPRPGDWGSVFQDVRVALSERVASQLVR
jgi:Flp pilus assembly protein TadD